MSDQLPRLGGLPEPEKYERLVERVPGLWWSDVGPFAGLHELNAVRVEYFRAVFNGFGGKRVLDVGCGGGILAEALAAEGARVTGIDPSAVSVEIVPARVGWREPVRVSVTSQHPIAIPFLFSTMLPLRSSAVGRGEVNR